jgi:hypothetical protein
MARRINISEARANLPEIAKRVARTPGAVQYIEHRDLDEDLALTTAGYIHYLETMVMELKKKVTKPFVLAGSIQSDLTDEELGGFLILGERLAGGSGGVRQLPRSRSDRRGSPPGAQPLHDTGTW